MRAIIGRPLTRTLGFRHLSDVTTCPPCGGSSGLESTTAEPTGRSEGTSPIFPRRGYEDWELEDSAEQGVETLRPIRDAIKARVLGLLEQLKVPGVNG